mmetsp:Transcript_2738/g.8131  ORF Transcript_2738/g.8131 Transcript_2738/m.8131 type:complete len:250 (-) Transcript_2738:1028-1777(-)
MFVAVGKHSYISILHCPISSGNNTHCLHASPAAAGSGCQEGWSQPLQSLHHYSSGGAQQGPQNLFRPRWAFTLWTPDPAFSRLAHARVVITASSEVQEARPPMTSEARAPSTPETVAKAFHASPAAMNSASSAEFLPASPQWGHLGRCASSRLAQEKHTLAWHRGQTWQAAPEGARQKWQTARRRLSSSVRGLMPLTSMSTGTPPTACAIPAAATVIPAATLCSSRSMLERPSSKSVHFSSGRSSPRSS